MWSVIVSGLATGALFAATALVYNVMFSTSKVLSITTGHIAMLGGVFGAYFITGLGLPWFVGLLGALLVGAAFGWLTDVLAIRRVGARRDEPHWLLTTQARATLVQHAPLERPARLLASARIGRTRLIDNLPVLPTQ